MGYIGSSALAIGAAVAVVLAIIIAFHDLALERLRKYCTPTAEEAEWAAAYVEISDDDVDVLEYGEEQLGGAESFLEEPEGSLLTGLWDGRIVRLLNERQLQHVASTGVHYGTACSLERQKRESTRCSRPLGLQFASPPTKGEKTINLVVCDGWRGLLEVPVPSWEQAELGTHPTPPSATRELLKGRGSAQLHIANAITEKVDGKFFVTDSSARSDAGRFGLIAFEGASTGTGRLLSVDLTTDTAEVVGDGIPFANGAVVTYDRSGVLVSALSARQIRFYPISPQSSTESGWRPVVTLPIPPDNITRVQVERKQLYAAVSYTAPFLPPFVGNCEAGSLLQQLRAAAWTAFNRVVMRLLPSSFFDMLIKVGASRSKRGGQVILFDEEGRIYRWLSRQSSHFVKFA
ncbi:strictosidine synthase domain-containing protein, putative [Eimeria tenella]|uniref:Strictosidine synthase domain-containing protein, putative n=1 Tax=Eimeria tenella TaxID=5802 RepID=U6L3I7_EIMTE|nr:strictosidine synthase domain-containing protein, putative [Eimeria tenella]CDJ43179.1 strictosidine synthase domain-containing protein, putative [Eimeria tenella]|eukprot:XP_013233929.1 strictosidine synthase domain-containing protein, putative [Eimeria tenella]